MARSEKNLTAVFTDTASAIRAKTGTTETICPLDFADKINAIETGGTGGGGGMKAYFEAGGKCAYSNAKSFDAFIKYSDTENVSNFDSMFRQCKNLVNIPNIDTSKLRSAESIFEYDNSLKVVDMTINSNLVEYLSAMFRYCSNLETIKLTCTTQIPRISCSFMAYSDNKLKTAILNIPKAVDFRYCFSNSGVVSANLGQLHKQTGETINGFIDQYSVDYERVFENCPNLENATLDIGSLIEGSSSRVILDCAFQYPNSPESRTAPLNITFLNADANVIRSFKRAFSNNTNIEVLPAVNCARASGLDTAFDGCTNLKELKFYNISSNINLSSCTKMTHDALVEVINNLATVTSTKTCTLGPNNLSKLTDIDRAIATGKGWNLAL